MLSLDDILKTGNHIYIDIVQDLIKGGNFHCMLLYFDEIPKSVKTKEDAFNVKKYDTISGIAIEVNGLFQAKTLHETLSESFKISSSLLIMIGAISSAVHQKDEKYYFFDSYSHNMSALSGADGTSVMIGFSNMDDLVSYLYAFYQSMHISLESQFDVLPVSITCSRTSSVGDQLLRYFSDQLRKKEVKFQRLNSMTTECMENSTQKSSMSTYMKFYMQNKRKDEKFRQK